MKVFVVSHGERPVAALVAWACGRTIHVTDMVSDASAFSLRPNDFAVWEFLGWAADHGFAEFDFGPVRYRGQEIFKMKWRMELRDYSYRYVSAPGAGAPRNPVSGIGRDHGRGAEDLAGGRAAPLRPGDGAAAPPGDRPVTGTAGKSIWDGHFDEASRTLGDTEAANSYLSVRNFSQVRDAVLDLVGDVSGTRVLDVGCGTGHLTRSLTGKNLVAGIDLSAGMLRFAAAKGLAPVRGSGLDLPFKDGTFDIVLANSVIQLISAGEAFMGELVRVTRKGGRVIVTTINARNAAISILRVVERKKYRHFRLYSLTS